ncbi:hypothetical protein DSECCO2_653610 [anaerobic digester metagenome]
MRRLLFFIISLMVCQTGLIAQRIDISPYPDAVSISLYGEDGMYLSNADAATLKSYFNDAFQPDKIIPIEDGYFSGFRLCFSTPECLPGVEQGNWIQVLTINEEAAFAWFNENTPELLALPFEGLKECVDGKTHTMSDYKKAYRKYCHLATRMYPHTIAPDGMLTDELTATIQMTALKIQMARQPALVSLDSGGREASKSPKYYVPDFDPWQEWIKCFDEFQQKSYVSLIEFNEPAVTPF